MTEFLLGVWVVILVMFSIRIWAFYKANKQVSQPHKEWDEDRIDIIGSNGNDGLHYEEVESKTKLDSK